MHDPIDLRIQAKFGVHLRISDLHALHIENILVNYNK